MKGARWFVIAGVVILFTLSILGLIYKTSSPASVPLSYQQTRIGFITLYSPDNLYNGQTEKAHFYLQSGATFGKDCSAAVEVLADPAQLALQTGTAPVTDHLSFTLDNQNRYWQTINIAPAVTVKDPTPASLDITYSITCNQSFLMDDAGEASLNLDPGASRFRRILGVAADSISQPGMFTSLSTLVISIVALWVTTNLEDEKRRNERWGRINIIEKEMETDIVHALGQLAVAEQDSQKLYQKWDRAQCTSLVTLRQRGEDRAGVIALLSQINRAIERKDDYRINTILSSANSFYRGNLQKSMQAFAAFRKGLINEENLEEIFKLWDEYDAYSENIIIKSLLKVQVEAGIFTEDKIKALLAKNDRGRRILRHKQLSEFIQKYHLTLPGTYEWDWPGYIQPIAPEIQDWLKGPGKGVLETSPFSSELVKKTWEAPTGWEAAGKISDAHAYVRNLNDLYILAQQMWNELREIEKDTSAGVFPLYWEVSQAEQTTDALGAILHQIAGIWMDFIALNPGAYLDMGTEERRALAACLGWHAGSIQTVAMRIQHKAAFMGMGSDARSRETRLLMEFLEDEKNLYDKDVQPSTDQMLDWLELRPPWLVHTALILVYPESAKETWSQALSQLRNEFHQRRVVIKEFELVQRHPTAREEYMEWKDEKLQAMLVSRIMHATGRARPNFNSLFQIGSFKRPASADKELVRLSRGSLSRMLELGNGILHHHALHNQTAAELTAQDFEIP